MFISELTPIFTELVRQPVAFLGGVFSGAFRLNLADDPVKSWLDRQTNTAAMPSTNMNQNGRSSGPQSISID